MADNLTITETQTWPATVHLIDTDEPVIGGEDGVSNAQAKALANRSQWLRAQIVQAIVAAGIAQDDADVTQLAEAIAALIAAAIAAGNFAYLDQDQAWDKDKAQTLSGTSDAASLDAMAGDSHTCLVGKVAELDADIDGTIVAPAAGYGFGAVHIFNNGTRSLTLSGWPAGGAANGGTLAGAAGTIDTIEFERMSVNGADKIRYNIFNAVGA